MCYYEGPGSERMPVGQFQVDYSIELESEFPRSSPAVGQIRNALNLARTNDCKALATGMVCVTTLTA
jgi:hypothetical protein